MSSTFTTRKSLEKQGTGDNENTWGTTLNTVLDNIDKALAGVAPKSVAGSADVTLTTDEAREPVQIYTGVLTGNINVIVPTLDAWYLVSNETSGSFTLTVKTSSGTGIAVTQGKKAFLYCDATNVVKFLATDDFPALSSANTFTADQTFQSTDAGAAAGPNLNLDRNSASPADNDILGAIPFKGRDDGGGTDTYAQIQAEATDVSAGTEDGILNILTKVAGTLATALKIGAGVFLGGQSDPGAGKINATDLQVAGTAVMLQGKHTVSVPAGAMTARTTNGAASATLESTTNKVMRKVLDFDASTDEFAQFFVPMPKGWNEGTITYQVLWENASGTGDVVWGLQGLARSDDDAIDTAFGTAVTVTDSVTAAGDLMISAESSAVTIGGTPAESDGVWFQIYRDADNGSDTLAGDARLIAARIFLTYSAGNDA